MDEIGAEWLDKPCMCNKVGVPLICAPCAARRIKRRADLQRLLKTFGNTETDG